MGRDINAEVGAWLPHCEFLALKFATPGRRGRHGAEFDDLVQEGLIAVWTLLKEGKPVRTTRVESRMRDYLRLLGRQGGHHPAPEAADAAAEL